MDFFRQINKKYFFALISCAAVIDTLLWILFMGGFDIRDIIGMYREHPRWLLIDSVTMMIESVILVSIGSFSGQLILKSTIKRRGFVSRLTVIVLSFLIIYAIAVAISYFYYRVIEYYSLTEFYMSVIIIGTLSCMFTLVILTEYFISLISKEYIRRRTTEADNHFLFNCLGMIAEQIDENPDNSKETLDDLLEVEKYMHVNISKPLVRLDEELAFLDKYFNLMQKRFPSCSLEIAPEVRETDGYVAPLSLQELVENAIKHNTHTASEPLVIAVYMTDEDYITVANRIQPRSGTMPTSSKRGLELMKSRYNILTDKQMIIKKSNNTFSVSIPLLSRFD